MVLLLNDIMYFTCCILAVITFVPSNGILLDLMSPQDVQRYFDVSSIDEVPEYEIVSPYIHEETARRKRRNLEIQDEIKEIKFQAFGEQLHMRLKENKHLIPDGLDIEQHNANGTINRIPLETNRCFYIGQLLSHNVSRVAVSTCKGMMGIIAMEQHNLYIRPLKEDHAKEYRRRRRDADNPHIIYRGSVEPQMAEDMQGPQSHFCALDPDFYSNATYLHDAVKLSKHKETFIKKKDQDKKHTVNKRDVACPVKYLEVRLLIDRDMTTYHGQDAVSYSLTLMNIVAARFAELSLGTLVNIHISKLDTLMTDSYRDSNGISLTITDVGQTTLESLAAFQRDTYIYDEDDPSHWDVAVMITRKNIRYGTSDALQGIAFEEGTCDVVYGAGLAQDSGLSTGQILAHEIGHTLGLDHDGSGPNAKCPDQVNVMSSSRPVGAGAFKWSPCSQQQFNTFLSNPSKSSCLNDVPPSIPTHRINSGERPGYQLVTPDEQCRLQDNVYTGFCDTGQSEAERCGRLTCRRYDNRCFYQAPAAEGTECAPGKWCISGDCVATQGQLPQPVNGGWSSWASFSQCSRSCGGGVRTRERCCDNPKPENGGSICIGKSSVVELCNTETCTTSQPEFAHEQCAATADEPWRGNLHTWEAYFDDQTEQELCAFKCLNNINWVVPRGPFFQDGTRCSVDGRNELKKCVQGNCVEFGCDNVLGSTQQFDNCRVCNGAGTSCTGQTGFYNDGNLYEFTTFLVIPAGSTTIEISNTTPLVSFMALKVTGTNDYIFGNTNSPESGEYYKNGIFVKYSYKIASEDIIIDGPTPVGFTAEVYRANRQQRPTITYTYYTSSGSQPGPPQPPPNEWRTTNGQCSVTCGNGIMQTIVECVSPSTGQVIADNLCDPATRPNPTPQACFQAPCPTQASNYWMVSEGSCSVTCGYGTQTRTAFCFSPSNGGRVADSQCDSNARPDTSPQSCINQACSNPNYWIQSEGPCSATCGFGTTVRSWRCYSQSTNEIVLDSQCDANQRPSDTQQSCFLQECPAVWLDQPYGDCDATCGGEATQTRLVLCVILNGQSYTQVAQTRCPFDTKPAETRKCENLPQCGRWDVGAWTQCSATCGRGSQFRNVICRPEGFESLSNPPTLSESECRESKPPTQQNCFLQECAPSTSEYCWVQGSLAECSVTCGVGVRTRPLLCVSCGPSGLGSTVDMSRCSGLPQPPNTEPCNQPACPGVWQIYQWSQCSVTCGNGVETRNVVCRPQGYETLTNPPILPNSQCLDTRPTSQRQCNLQTCPATTDRPDTGLEYLWLPFNWDQCSATCGYGVRTRQVWCVQNSGSNYALVDDENLCNGLVKPDETETCVLPTCEPGTQTEPPAQNSPDQGITCAGLYKNTFNSLDHISQPNEEFCNETIVAPAGQKIMLTFHRCNIRCDEGDEGIIRDGHRYFKLCCEDDTFQWTSMSNVVQLEHRTTNSGHGYEVSAMFLNNAVSPNTGCDEVLTDTSGSVSSPSTNAIAQTCEATIVAPPGKKIHLDFQSIDLIADAPWAPEYCLYPSDDNLEIFDLETNIGTRYCGTYGDKEIEKLKTTPLNNKVLIKYRTNEDSRSGSGFALNYQIVDS